MDRAWGLRAAGLVAVVGAALAVSWATRSPAPPPVPSGPAAPPPAPAPVAPPPPRVLVHAAVAPPHPVAVSWMCVGARGQLTPGPDGAFEVEARGDCEVRLERSYGGTVLVGPWEPLREGGRYAPPAPEGLGLVAELDGERLRVTGAEPSGPAGRAGVRVGDRLVRVGDTPAAELGPESLEEIEGDVILEVERDGVVQQIRIP